MLTCFGQLSRNRTFGYRLGKGEKVEDIIKTSKGVVEGYTTLEVVIKYAEKHNIDMPIIRLYYLGEIFVLQMLLDVSTHLSKVKSNRMRLLTS